MKDTWIGFLSVMLTTFVGFGFVYGQIADIREELGRIDGLLSGIEKRIERMQERASLNLVPEGG